MVTYRGQGVFHRTDQYDYEILCADLAQKQFVPLLATVKARSIASFPSLLRRDGEEFTYVLKGTLTVHTEFYQPMELQTGDSCFR